MLSSIGILFALGAFFGWGLGDFLIQQSTRKSGVIFTLWIIHVVGSVTLLPFALKSGTPLASLWSIPILIVTAAHMANGFSLFYLFKRIHISIVQPIVSLELPFSVIVASILFHEKIQTTQWGYILLIFCGILLLSFVANPIKEKKVRLEKGVLLSVLAACIATSMNISTGAAVDQYDPWFVIWAVSILITVILLPIVLQNNKDYTKQFSKNPILFVVTGLVDTLGWISFSFAALHLPVSLVVGLTQGYILLSVLLGIIFNKERLHSWQYGGILVAIVGLIALAFTA